MEDFNFANVLVNIVTDELCHMLVVSNKEGRTKILKCLELRDCILTEEDAEKREKAIKKYWSLISKAESWSK